MSVRCTARAAQGAVAQPILSTRRARVGSALLLAILAVTALCARAEPAPPATPACPAPEALQPAHLYGLWQLRLWPDGTPEHVPDSTATSIGALLFERHPEYPGSVRGELRRAAAGQDLTALVSGDVIDGLFNLDESDDGQRISAVWVGEPQDCGRSIRGTRRPAEGRPASETTLQFHLRKLPGWQ